MLKISVSKYMKKGEKMNNKNIKIIIYTRDGNHTVNNQFSLEDIKNIVKALNAGKIDYIEVGYGYGLGSFEKDGYPTDREILKTAIENSDFSKIAILVFPNKVSIEELKKFLDLDIGLVRIAVQAANVEPGKEYIKVVKDAGINVGGFMMMASKVSTDDLVKESLKLKEYGADNITITDSAGAMIMEEVEEAIKIIKEKTNLTIGFHTHDNLGLSMANSIMAIKSGAEFVDTALAGLGAGAGNTRTESLVAVLEKSGYKTKANLYKTLDGVVKLSQIVEKYGFKLQNIEDNLMVGYTGVYSTFKSKTNCRKIFIGSRILLEEISKKISQDKKKNRRNCKTLKII